MLGYWILVRSESKNKCGIINDMSPFSHLLILLATPTFAMLLPRRTAFITSSGILSSAFTISDNNNNQRLTKSTTSSGIKSSSSVSTDTQSTIIYQPLSIMLTAFKFQLQHGVLQQAVTVLSKVVVIITIYHMNIEYQYQRLVNFWQVGNYLHL